MALGSLEDHLQMQYGKAMGGRRHWGTTPPGRDQHTYNMALSTSGDLRNCPVEGCWGRAAMRTKMQVHFFHRHVQDTVIILEEGNLTQPRCPWYDMLVPWQALNGRNISTS